MEDEGALVKVGAASPEAPHGTQNSHVPREALEPWVSQVRCGLSSTKSDLYPHVAAVTCNTTGHRLPQGPDHKFYSLRGTLRPQTLLLSASQGGGMIIWRSQAESSRSQANTQIHLGPALPQQKVHLMCPPDSIFPKPQAPVPIMPMEMEGNEPRTC